MVTVQGYRNRSDLPGDLRDQKADEIEVASPASDEDEEKVDFAMEKILIGRSHADSKSSNVRCSRSRRRSRRFRPKTPLSARRTPHSVPV